MLLSFSVSNYRSIRDEATLSMFASRRIKEHPENAFALPGNNKISLLRSIAVYGANASGKSNIYKAMQTLFNLIKDSAGFSLHFTRLSESFDPFLLDSKYQEEPTSFNLKFASPGKNSNDFVVYDYSLSYNSKEVLAESLFFNPKGQRARLFERTGKEVLFGEYFSKGNALFKELLMDLENSQKLLLSLLLNLEIEEFKPVKSFLNYQVWWYDPQTIDFYNHHIQGNLAAYIHKNSDEKSLRKFSYLMKALDTGIENIDVVQEENVHPTVMLRLGFFKGKLETYHKGNVDGKESLVRFGVDRESDGTKNLLTFGGYIIIKLMEGGVVFIDEIDRSLHPKIVEYLFKIFNDPSINTKNAQLIATTHSAMIMKNDLFRRDQILIAERGDNGASTYYTLADVQGLRASVPFERYYYSGILGGTPDINDVDFRAEFL